MSRLGEFLDGYKEQQLANSNKLIPDDLGSLQNSLPLDSEVAIDDYAFPEGKNQSYKDVNTIFNNSISKNQCTVLLNGLKNLAKRAIEETKLEGLSVMARENTGYISEKDVALFAVSAGRVRFIKEAYEHIAY
ncbi:hypothetical protein KA043_01620 [Candidatus Saccharibacteria bacterium]|nr:hypothetical protein [Candidatus Saccharibacteria bacterium]